jgi:hypothetical protein
MAKRKTRRPPTTKAKKTARKTARPSSRRPARRTAKAAPRRVKGRTRPRSTSKTVARKMPRTTAKARTASPARSPKRPVAKNARPKPLGLQRERRRLGEEAITASVPSSLNFDRSASAAKSGREAMKHNRREHTESGPALTGGDVDADWEDGYSEGDEAPGGDNPTPDQDVVEEIGRALGVEYDDAEELQGADKIAKRDTNRWEYDPASAEDYRDRNKKQ